MKMIPTQNMQQLIKSQLAASPLYEGEIRRIEGMGDLYVSRKRELETSHDEYTYMYSLIIEEETYYFFSRLGGH